MVRFRRVLRKANDSVIFLIIGVVIFSFGFLAFKQFEKENLTMKTNLKEVLEVPNIYCEFDEWKNRVDIFQINRESARSFFVPYSSLKNLFSDVKQNVLNSVKIKDSNNIKTLNGDWKFSLDYKPSERNQDFFKQDYDVSNWKNIKVPSNWQMEGYDFPIYVNFRYPWTGYENLEFYKAPEIFNPVGSYKKIFDLDESWIGDKIYISFQGVESCFYLWVNGKFVGYSEDSFSPSEFDITDFVMSGKNSVSVQVFRWSDGSFIEDQDFIRLSGIFRDVFLYRTPQIHIRDFEVITDLDEYYLNSKLIVNFNLLNHLNQNKQFSISTLLFDNDWNLISKEEGVGNFDNYYTYKDKIMQCNFNSVMDIENPKKWSSEDPNLYNLVVVLKNDLYGETQAIHTRIGFRKFELKGNQMYLNGKPILFKGVNRHETHPLKGRAISISDMEFDIKEIKKNNINAVRTSHYPNHNYFVSLCNEYGVYLIDEANIEAHGVEGEIPGNNEIWKAPCLDRVMSLIERDKNNPCVLIWSLGNESGGGSVFKYIYDYVKERDKTRLVHYEGERDEYYASDIVSKMYVKIEDIEKQSRYMKNKPYILCEYAHSMGNSGGSLNKYIEKFESIDNVQGGFIWDFIDQGIYKDSPKVGVLNNSLMLFDGKFEGYLKEGYRGKGYSGVIFYDELKYVKLNEFTIDLKVKPSVYEGEGCIYFKKGYEFGIQEVTNYRNSNNRVVEFFIRDNSQRVESIVFIVPENWADNWQRITVSYDGRLIKLFLNGNLVGEKEFVYGVGYFGDSVQIGGNNSEIHCEGMNGVLDEIKFFSKKIDFDQIDKLRVYDRNFGKLLWIDFDRKEEILEFNKYKDEKYLAFGGDFNDSPNDSAFCANGILLSTRKLKPQVHEIKHVYQNIDIYDKDILNGEIIIKNKNLFVNLNNYILKWDYLVDGEVIEGDSAVINLDPMSSEVFKITDFHKILSLNGKEFFINLKFVLKEGNFWANKGFEIASEQFKIPLEAFIVEANSLKREYQNFNVKEDGSNVFLISDEFEMEFDINKGSLKKYVYRGEKLLSSPLLVDFWNPLNDNERLFKIYNDIKFWKDIFKDNNYTRYELYKNEHDITLKFYKTLYNLNNSELITTYKVNEYGDVNVNLFVDLLSHGIPHARSVGFKVFIPKDYCEMEFYGRGPFENYNDRKEGSKIGVYKTNVDKQFTEYVRPQRTGNLTDVRWVRFYKKNGNNGILFTNVSNEFLQVNVSKYNDGEFEKNHKYQMNEFSSTIVNLRSKDYGSTFETFDDKAIDYIEGDCKYAFSFTISAINNHESPMSIWKRIF